MFIYTSKARTLATIWPPPAPAVSSRPASGAQTLACDGGRPARALTWPGWRAERAGERRAVTSETREASYTHV